MLCKILPTKNPVVNPETSIYPAPLANVFATLYDPSMTLRNFSKAPTALLPSGPPLYFFFDFLFLGNKSGFISISVSYDSLQISLIVCIMHFICFLLNRLRFIVVSFPSAYSNITAIIIKNGSSRFPAVTP